MIKILPKVNIKELRQAVKNKFLKEEIPYNPMQFFVIVTQEALQPSNYPILKQIKKTGTYTYNLETFIEMIFNGK